MSVKCTVHVSHNWMFLTKYSNSMMTQFKKNQNDRKLSLKEIGKLSLVLVWQIIPENYLV